MNPRALELVTRTVLAALGVITALPAVALVLSGTALDLSYGISAPADPMVLALLQHRGALQAALGAALVWAAFQPVARTPVALTAIATKSTFLALIALLPAESRSGALPGVVFDVIAIIVLAVIAVRRGPFSARTLVGAAPGTPTG
jgi:hypothetical protein